MQGVECKMSAAEIHTQKDQQQEYIRRIGAGERELIPELWELLQPLTRKFISRYIFPEMGNRLYEFDDLLDLSYFALIAALDGYDSSKGAFSTYYFIQVQRVTAELRGTRKRHDINRDTVSLNLPLDDTADADTLLDMLEDKTAAEPFDDAERRAYLEELHAAFVKLDERLTDQERQVIHARYYERRTLEEIGQELALSKERIRSIEVSAIRKYRRYQYTVNLEAFYDYDKAYKGTGLQSFLHSGMSSVERLAEYHEQKTIEWEERYRRKCEIVNCGRYVSYGKARAYIDGLTDSY